MPDFSEIYLVTEKLNKVAVAEIEAAEKDLGTEFPAGYQEFLTTLGFGTYCDLVFIYPPAKILAEYAQYRQTFVEYSDLWDERPAELTAEIFSQLIVFSHAIDGDLLAFQPAKPDLIYVLPRHESMIYRAGENFYQALEILFENYGVPRNSRIRWFNSHVEQCYFSMINGDRTIARAEFLDLVRQLQIRFIDNSAERSVNFFVKEFEGEIHLGELSEARQNFVVRFDCEKAALPEKLRALFAARGFKVRSEGKKK